MNAMANDTDGHSELSLTRVSCRKRLLVDSTVTVTDDALVWQDKNDQSSSNEKGRLAHRQILVAEVTDGTKAGTELSELTIHYVHTEMCGKEIRIKRSKLTFSGSRDICTDCANRIEELLGKKESHRPKSLLVFINPASGSSNGEKLYRNKVVPIIELMGIKTEVVVTENVKHAEEYLAEYDLTKIDAVVAMGGDGTIQQVCSGLMKRTQKDNSLNLDDAEINLIKPSVPVAVIPAGTGNGLAMGLNYTMQVEGCALSLVLGQTTPKDVTILRSNGHFQTFSFLLVGYGMFGTLIEMTESRRWMGKARYLVMMPSLLKRHPSFDVEVDYLRATSDEPNPWQTFKGQVIGVNMFPGGFVNRHMSEFDRSSGELSLSVMKPNVLRQRLQFLARLFKRDPAVFDLECIEDWMVTHFRVRFIGDWSQFRPAHVLDIDGEVWELPAPEFEAKLHPGLIDMICLDTSLVPPKFKKENTE